MDAIYIFLSQGKLFPAVSLLYSYFCLVSSLIFNFAVVGTLNMRPTLKFESIIRVLLTIGTMLCNTSLEPIIHLA